jgi:hypothetical protein
VSEYRFDAARRFRKHEESLVRADIQICGNGTAGGPLANRLAAVVTANAEVPGADVVVPVPVHSNSAWLNLRSRARTSGMSAAGQEAAAG